MGAEPGHFSGSEAGAVIYKPIPEVCLFHVFYLPIDIFSEPESVIWAESGEEGSYRLECPGSFVGLSPSVLPSPRNPSRLSHLLEASIFSTTWLDSGGHKYALTTFALNM